MKYRSSSLTGDGITMAVAAGAATLRKNAYVMGTADSLEVEKLSVRGTVGEVEQDENGKYKPETYKLDQIRVRFMAPSTHHTMGGVKIDAQRHVLDNDGNAIAGLYAAGEITGGRLASITNLRFLIHLMEQIREAIANACFLDFRKEFYSKYDMSRNF